MRLKKVLFDLFYLRLFDCFALRREATGNEPIGKRSAACLLPFQSEIAGETLNGLRSIGVNCRNKSVIQMPATW